MNDIKNGKGKLILSDGSFYEVSFENGVMSGPGTYTDASGKSRSTMFYYGMEVRMDEQNPDCYNLMWLNLLFCLLAIGFLATYFALFYNYNSTMYLVLAIIFYIVQISETFCGRTWGFLNNIEPVNVAIPIINNFRSKYPIVEFHMQNYHYEWRPHTVHRQG